MRGPAHGLMALALLTLAGCASNPPANPPAPAGTPPPASAPTTPEAHDVVTTPSGLKYEDLVVGNGALAENGMVAVVNYTGWLTDGTKFDSSYDRGQTFAFRIGAGQVIAGWDQGIPGMRVGGKRRLTIPPSLAYGNRAVGSIPANSTLVFEVELVSIVGK